MARHVIGTFGDDLFCVFLLSDRLLLDFLQGVYGISGRHLNRRQVLVAWSAESIITASRASHQHEHGLARPLGEQEFDLYVSRHATACEYLTVLHQWLIDC